MMNIMNIKEKFGALHPECEIFEGVRDIGNGVMQEYISFRGETIIAPMIPKEMLPEDDDIILSILEKQYIHCMQRQRIGEELSELFSSWENVKGLVRPTLVNAERSNMEDIPYVIWNDLYMVFRVDVTVDADEIGSVVVNNQLLEQLGVDIVTLREQALTNASSRSVELLNILDALAKELRERGVPEWSVESARADADEVPLFILRDEQDGRHGASALLYAHRELQQLAGRFGAPKLLIIPASIHEVIVAPYDGLGMWMSLEYTISMVRGINSSELQPEEVLSDNIYVYDVVTGAFGLVDDEALRTC